VIEKDIDIPLVLRRDPAEVTRFARLVTASVYNIVYSYLQNKEDTEEVVQDTVMKALNSLSQFRQESSLKTWVYRMAINRAKDQIKYKNRQKRSAKVISIDQDQRREIPKLHLSDRNHPGLELESKEDMQMLLSCIEQLPDNQKKALYLAKFDQMKMKDIAIILDSSPKSVESLLSRARTNLRKLLIEKGINH